MLSFRRCRLCGDLGCTRTCIQFPGSAPRAALVTISSSTARRLRASALPAWLTGAAQSGGVESGRRLLGSCKEAPARADRQVSVESANVGPRPKPRRAKARNSARQTSKRLGRALCRNRSGYHRRSRVEAKMNSIDQLGQPLMAKHSTGRCQRSKSCHNPLSLLRIRNPGDGSCYMRHDGVRGPLLKQDRATNPDYSLRRRAHLSRRMRGPYQDTTRLGVSVS